MHADTNRDANFLYDGTNSEFPDADAADPRKSSRTRRYKKAVYHRPTFVGKAVYHRPTLVGKAAHFLFMLRFRRYVRMSAT